MSTQQNRALPNTIRYKPEYAVVEVLSESATGWPTSLKYKGKTYNIHSVGRKTFNRDLQAIEYNITIGTRKTKLWKDETGTWYVRPKA